MRTFTKVAETFRAALLACLVDYGYKDDEGKPTILVIKQNQKRKQGRADDGIYYQMLNPDNHGWQGRRYNPQGTEAGHREVQLYQTMMRLTCLVHDDIKTGYDSNDLAALTQMCVNGLPFVEILRRGKIGVQRVTPIRTLVFTDEGDDYAEEASFDVNITFTKTVEPNTRTVDAMDLDILRI